MRLAASCRSFHACTLAAGMSWRRLPHRYERYARALWICRVVDSCWVRVARARVYVTGMPCSRMPLVHTVS